MAEDHFQRVTRLAADLPGIQSATSNRTASLKIRGKSFVRMKEKMDGVLVVMIPLGLKESLMDAEPDKYFETPHYAGWPAMLVRLDALDDRELAHRLACAWAEKAPKSMVAEYRCSRPFLFGDN
jgi:hypothetical protein